MRRVHVDPFEPTKADARVLRAAKLSLRAVRQWQRKLLVFELVNAQVDAVVVVRRTSKGEHRLTHARTDAPFTDNEAARVAIAVRAAHHGLLLWITNLSMKLAVQGKLPMRGRTKKRGNRK